MRPYSPANAPRPGLPLKLILGAVAGVALAAAARRSNYSFRGRTVIITGGSRGLGLVLTREFAREGAVIALLARHEEELERAERELSARGARVMAVSCDIRDRVHVDRAVQLIADRLGRIDILINNAGVIQVGPLEHMTFRDFEDAMAVHFFGPLSLTLAVAPHLRRAGGGRIVNLASVGGKIAVPHLLPYSASKFALVGLSDGLRAELHRDRILVTTVCPGLMRTGSPRNALFKGRHREEYAWFSVADSLPLLSMNAERAGRKIVTACRRGTARVVLGLPAKLAGLINELLPETTASVAAMANRLLPRFNPTAGIISHPGYDNASAWVPSFLTGSSDRAAARNNEIPSEG
jgi:NAD(P)-dependent dehydrogenase (short-subunit alcohol dehydrogenase family)